MLQIKMPLAPQDQQASRVATELLPMAGVEMNMRGAERCVDITLKGVIAGNSVDTLGQFLTGVSSLVGNKWSLQMKDLLVLSTRGMSSLARFAEHLRHRGFRIEVHGVNQNVYSALKESRMTQAFAWAD